MPKFDDVGSSAVSGAVSGGGPPEIT